MNCTTKSIDFLHQIADTYISDINKYNTEIILKVFKENSPIMVYIL